MSRYIDADKLKENFIGVHEDEINFAFDGYAIKCTDEAPSIDIALADDGTLSVEVEDATKVKRVLVEDGENGDLYYADRPQGEWIEIDDVSISCRCSVCGWEAHLYEDDVYGMPYCPNCGCRMKGADDE